RGAVLDRSRWDAVLRESFSYGTYGRSWITGGENSDCRPRSAEKHARATRNLDVKSVLDGPDPLAANGRNYCCHHKIVRHLRVLINSRTLRLIASHKPAKPCRPQVFGTGFAQGGVLEHRFFVQLEPE